MNEKDTTPLYLIALVIGGGIAGYLLGWRARDLEVVKNDLLQFEAPEYNEPSPEEYE